MLHMHCLAFSYVCLISLPLASSHLLSPPLLLTLAHSSFNLHSVTCSVSCFFDLSICSSVFDLHSFK
ncbi:hypothetical protein XELAEV_18031440mg [Xenopus laevis]|uniref:Secreted protein n=1 Tax=Xenopus laevis TaxID=8355 RepID=A0A974CN22_XENLA|nr:hypothetical protein XELAEV_18031440mg [Xenopus laevis]